MGPRILVLDLDGTLIRSEAVKTRAYYDIFPPEARVAVDAVRAEDRYASRFQIVERVLKLWRGSASQADIARFARDYNDICEAHQISCPERPGAAALLEKVSGKHYLCSGTFEESLKRILAARRWERHFRAAFGGPAKKIENVRKVMALERCGPQDVTLVGDTRDDLDAAAELGCGFRGVRSEATDFDEKDVTMIGRLGELEALC